MAVHLISSNVSDLGKSDVGYLQFPFVQKGLTKRKTVADPAVRFKISKTAGSTDIPLGVMCSHDVAPDFLLEKCSKFFKIQKKSLKTVEILKF